VVTSNKRYRKPITCNKYILTRELNIADRYKVAIITGTRRKNRLKIKVGTRQIKVIYKGKSIKSMHSSELYTIRTTSKRITAKCISNKKCAILISCKNLGKMKYTSAIYRPNSNIFKTFIYATHYSINFRGINRGGKHGRRFNE